MSANDSLLVGTWLLTRFELRLPDGTVTHPFGEEVDGLLMYDETGHMSAVFGSAKRQVSSEVDLEKAGASQNYDSFMSYCGPYEVSGDQILHRVTMSSLEAWTGTQQERRFEIIGDELVLETLPLVLGDTSPIARLLWRRTSGSDAKS